MGEDPTQPTQIPEAFYNSIKSAVEPAENKGRELLPEESRKMQDGFALEEMMHSAGWAVVQDLLTNMPKAHVDPRGMTREEWVFAEENAFHQGQVASELLDGLYRIIEDAHQLQRIQLGEVSSVQRMRF